MTTPIILSSNADGEAGAVPLLQDAAGAGNASFTPDGSKATLRPGGKQSRCFGLGAGIRRTVKF
ncbi:hypothetical protein HB775_30920 (plasmid) [Rhizobium leguminosarum bv. trifolii]|nr:hypothetical protein HB775_30920 [Rhizobium leguminosarum bv. trifolii]